MTGYQPYEADRKFILQTDWHFGACNIDDDFHTDIVFIRVSVNQMKEFAGSSFSNVMLHYKNFTGVFYYSKEETARICSQLVSKARQNPGWLRKLHTHITQWSHKLGAIFEDFSPSVDFQGCNPEQLRNLYIAQLNAHTELYKAAWVLEVLQVETYGLTDFLREVLTQKKLAGEELNEVFLTLTSLPEASVYKEAQSDFYHIVKEIRDSSGLRDLFSQPIKYVRLYLPYDIMRRLTEHRERFGYLEYHGFGTRHLPDIGEYILRIQNCIRKPATSEEENQEGKSPCFGPLKPLQKKLGLSKSEFALFRAYAGFGLLKSTRRFAELKNFYFLDKIIAQLARCHRIPEAWVRFMTPDEVIQLLNGRPIQWDHMRRRSQEMVYWIRDKREQVSTDQWVLNCIRQVKEGLERSQVDTLKGIPAYPGLVKGRAVVLHRGAEKNAAGFRSGDIIVSIEADPDLVLVIAEAAAVVTDQGGITCHIATIAREWKVPCITGTQYATKMVSTGDILLVDAFRGEVKIVEKNI